MPSTFCLMNIRYFTGYCIQDDGLLAGCFSPRFNRIDVCFTLMALGSAFLEVIGVIREP